MLMFCEEETALTIGSGSVHHGFGKGWIDGFIVGILVLPRTPVSGL